MKMLDAKIKLRALKFKATALGIAGFFLLNNFYLESAWAASGSHGAEHVPSIADLKWFWINFLLYVVCLYFVIRKPLRAFWKNRRDGIAQAVEAAKTQKASAIQALQDAQHKLAGLTQEAKQITSNIQLATKGEVNQILEEARRRADRILVQAKDLAAAEKKSASEQIRRELIEEVTERARQSLVRDFDANQDKQLRDAALSSVRSLIQ